MLLTLLACGTPASDDSAAAPVDVVDRLTSRGPFPIGYAETSVSYDAPTGPRDLRTVVWYPSATAEGARAPAGLYQPGPDVLDTPPVAEGPFPVAVFSHGHQGYAENSGFLMEQLASHGWVVVAPDHTGDTTFDDPERTTEIYFQRPLDVSAVLDAVPDLAPVAGHSSDGPALLLGHSFGGYTTFADAGAAYDLSVCPSDQGFCATMTEEWAALFEAGFHDPRFGAFVAMAPGDFALFGAAGLQAMTAPVLHMTASEDQGPGSEGDDTWAALADGDDVGVILEGGGHQSFTDYADLLEDVPLDATEGFRIVDAFVLAWAERLLGDTEADVVLDGERSVSDAATLR